MPQTTDGFGGVSLLNVNTQLELSAILQDSTTHLVSISIPQASLSPSAISAPTGLTILGSEQRALLSAGRGLVGEGFSE